MFATLLNASNEDNIFLFEKISLKYKLREYVKLVPNLVGFFKLSSNSTFS